MTIRASLDDLIKSALNANKLVSFQVKKYELNLKSSSVKSVGSTLVYKEISPRTKAKSVGLSLSNLIEQGAISGSWFDQGNNFQQYFLFYRVFQIILYDIEPSISHIGMYSCSWDVVLWIHMICLFPASVNNGNLSLVLCDFFDQDRY